MNSVEAEVKDINNLAFTMRTSHSQISVDWVLDINCYNTNRPDANLEFDMKQGLITGKLCVPCDAPGVSSEQFPSNLTTLSKNNTIFDSFGMKHSASLLSTCSISFSGLLDVQKLRSFLDDILFGNGSRVGGGYRQPSVTYVNLLDRSEAVAPNGNGNVTVYSSAPQTVSSLVSSDNVVKAVGHSIDTDEMKIYRIKGVLHVKDEYYLQVLQGVFDVFEVKPSTFLRGSEGDISAGLNRIVVIGRSIDRDVVEKGFLSCLISTT